MQLHVYGVYPATRRPSKRAGGSRPSRVYDARWHVDGHQFRRRFERKGWAQAHVDALREGFVAGLPFDPDAARFVEPENPATMTFAAAATDYLRRRWASWAPARRQDCQRELSRACVFLVTDDDAPIEVAQRVALDEALRRGLLVPEREADANEDDDSWLRWLEERSLPLSDVTDQHLHAFLEWARSEAIDGTRRSMAPTTIARTRTVVRAVFRSAQARRLIEWDPFDAVEWTSAAGDEVIDPDLVMSPQQVLAMADAVDARYACFVLAMGACGLRPSEARALQRRDVDLDALPAVLTPRGSHSDVPQRFFADGESRRRPLKGRSSKARRSIPIPKALVPRFADHLDRFVGERADALVFTTRSGARIHLSNFHRDVWESARATLFADDHPLRNVRRHDLRHAAITAWLNAGVLLKTAQRWSGHRLTSVLLNTYLGVMRDDGEVSIGRMDRSWDAATGEAANPTNDPEDQADT